MFDLSLRHILLQFRGFDYPILSIDNFACASTESFALSGPSGCGKTSFIHLIAGLIVPQSGKVFWGATDFYLLGEAKRDQWRGHYIGLIHQNFYLFPGMSALENILLPLHLTGNFCSKDRIFAEYLLNRVHITNLQQKITSMSRGEMQRIALARALIRRPAIILADEPTASLDPENSLLIGDLLLELAAEYQASLITITHDETLYARFPRQVKMRSGQIISDHRISL